MSNGFMTISHMFFVIMYSLISFAVTLSLLSHLVLTNRTILLHSADETGVRSKENFKA